MRSRRFSACSSDCRLLIKVPHELERRLGGSLPSLGVERSLQLEFLITLGCESMRE